MAVSLTTNEALLERYDERVADLKLAVKASSAKYAGVIEKLKEFFQEYFKERYQKNVLDAQNLYFSKKTAQQFIELIKESADSVSESELEAYVSKAIKEVDLGKYFLTSDAVNKLKKDTASYFKSIIDILDFNFGDKKDSQKKRVSKKPSASSLSKTDKFKASLIESSLVKTTLNLGYVSDFLKKNVFTNFSRIVSKQKLVFDQSALTMIKSKRAGFRAAFSKLWVPDLLTLNKQFRQYERVSFSSVVRKTRANFKKLRDKFDKKLYSIVDFVFPLTFLKAVFKMGKWVAGVGLRVVKTALRVGFSVVEKGLKFAVSAVSFIGKTAFKTGVRTLKLLTKTLSKIRAFKALKLTGRVLIGFFKTYVGAYALGYVVGSVYGNVKKIVDFANKLFADAKDFFNEHVYEPFVAPVVDWFASSRFMFFVDEVKKSLFGESSADFESLLAIKDDAGRPFFKRAGSLSTSSPFSALEQEIDKASETMSDLMNDLTFDSVVNKAVAPLTGTLIGGAVGWRIGASIGTAFLGPVGGFIGAAVGYLAGTSSGGWLGKMIGDLFVEKGGFNKVQRQENAFARASREYGGSNDEVREAFFNPMESDYMMSLADLGVQLSTANFYDTAESEGGDKLAPLVSAGAVSQHEIDLLRSGAPGGVDKFRRNVSSLKRLSSIGYERAYAEVNEAFARMNALVNEKSHKGFISVSHLADSDWTTSLTLDESSVLKIPKEVSGYGAVNPFWFKAIRAAELQNLMFLLSSKKISLMNFFESYEELNDPVSLAKRLGDSNKFSDGFNASMTAKDLIFPNLVYRRNADKYKERIALWVGNAMTYEFNPNDIEAFIRTLPIETQEKIRTALDEQKSLPADLAGNSWEALKALADGNKSRYWRYVKKNYKLTSGEDAFSTINAIVARYAAIPYLEEFGKGNILFIAEGNADQSYVGRNVDEHLANYDVSDFLRLRTSETARNVRDEADAEAAELASSQDFIGAYLRTIDRLVRANPDLKYRIDQSAVIRRLVSMKGGAANVLDVLEETGAETGAVDLLIQAAVEATVRGDVSALASQENVLADLVGSRFETAMVELNAASPEMNPEQMARLKTALNISELETMFSQYSQLVSNNTDFIQNKVIPLLTKLKEKGVLSAEELAAAYTAFSIKEEFTDESNPTNDTAGEAAPPSVD